MIYNVYLSIYFNIQGISDYILAWDIAKCLANLWIAYQMDNIWHALYPWTAQTPIPHTAKTNGHILLQQSIYSYILVCTLHICVYTPIYCDIYGHIHLQKGIYSYIRVCTLHICIYTPKYCDMRTYTTSTKYILVYSPIYCDMRTYATSTTYILVYTRMYSEYLCIYDWIPLPGTFPGTWTCPFLEI